MICFAVADPLPNDIHPGSVKNSNIITNCVPVSFEAILLVDANQVIRGEQMIVVSVFQHILFQEEKAAFRFSHYFASSTSSLISRPVFLNFSLPFSAYTSSPKA